jgi:hypothetical protein
MMLLRKTFLSNSLNVMLCKLWLQHQSLCHTMSTLLTVSQSQFKLNSEDCYSRVLYNFIITNSLTWQHELRTHWAHHCCSYRNWRKTQNTMSVREESDKHHIKWLCMHCENNSHFIKNCKLLSAVWSHIINIVTAETVKKTTEEEKNSKKE